MATYEEIYGKRVKEFTSDPTLDTTYEGQVWYNSTDGVLKSVIDFGAWISGANTATGRARGGGAGIKTAAVYFGGYADPGGGNQNATEEYNGFAWSSGGNLGTAKSSVGGNGTQTAALSVAGVTTAVLNQVEEYDGSSWSGGGTYPISKRSVGSTGPQTASLAFGGNPNVDTTAEYDGSSWTAGGAYPISKDTIAGCGPQTAGLGFGGFPATNVTCEYNGSSWSTSGSMSLSGGRGQSGTQTSALAIAGGPLPVIAGRCESYDGTSWSGAGVGSLGTPRYDTMSSCGASNTSAVVFGGYDTANNYSDATEEYNFGLNTITKAAWASGGSLNTGRTLGGSAITSGTSGIVFGGSAPYTGKTESYDGSSFSETGDMNTARGYLSGFGTSTAAVAAGGYNAPNNPQSLVEEWNGSAWSEETNLPAARKSAGNCGTLTAGLVMGGSSAQPYGPNIVNTTFEYDGSSWTTGGTLPEAKGQAASGGTQTAAFYAGGRTAPGRSAKTAFYNGSSWSEGADVATISPSSGGLGATGTTSAGLGTSGDNLTNIYDGTAWATSPNYSTARNRGFGGATASDALLVGGYSPSLSPNYTNHTEEFNGEIETLNVETLTQS